MKKLDLRKAAEEFEMIGEHTHLFYNPETGEFDFYIEFSDIEDAADPETFERAPWIAAPDQWELNGYRIMTDFAGAVTDPRKNELLCVALNGKGPFRRFKDVVRGVDLLDEWHAFKRAAYIEIARDWAEANGIEAE